MFHINSLYSSKLRLELLLGVSCRQNMAYKISPELKSYQFRSWLRGTCPWVAMIASFLTLVLTLATICVMPCGTYLACGCYICDVTSYFVHMAFSFGGILFYINKLLNCVRVSIFCWGCVVNNGTYIKIGIWRWFIKNCTPKRLQI